ncbi:30S ribosomal protein S21 [Candidatus Cytomitobacter indipagum]|nr:30S ribosomal protein S21 [Candidatus Cytomitobacter indipagum]
MISVNVVNNEIQKAWKLLKRFVQREGIGAEQKRRRHFLKPSEQKAMQKKERVRKIAKARSKSPT